MSYYLSTKNVPEDSYLRCDENGKPYWDHKGAKLYPEYLEKSQNEKAEDERILD